MQFSPFIPFLLIYHFAPALSISICLHLLFLSLIVPPIYPSSRSVCLSDSLSPLCSICRPIHYSVVMVIEYTLRKKDSKRRAIFGSR